ncbi:MAG: LysM peptidoglycan-binding domain-containing protein [Clostridiaceae bacterium]|nr:LysM peptidoglycan-binding domain-containing protein [Clostridiaceae bacterium]
MSSVIKINASVYSRIGYGRAKNTNSFYLNGKFTSQHYVDNMQASMENRGMEYFFAIADNMVYDYPEQGVSASILKEISRFHEKFAVSGGDIKSKIEELESRVNETERLITSFLEMNRVPETSPEWNLGFSGLLFSEGRFVAVSSGNCRVFMMRDGRFRPLASDAARAKREIESRIMSDLDNKEKYETDDIVLPGEENKGNAVVSDIYDIAEGDSFILISNGLYEALGEEKIEDILALRSDSTYIAYRLVDEAAKRKTVGDITALVVQVEKLIENPGKARKSIPRVQQPKQEVKSRVERLNKAPAITYKYNRRKTSKYQSSILIGMVFVTVLILFGIIFLMIRSLINTGRENLVSPTPSTKPTVTATPTNSPDDIFPTEDPEETTTPTPTPTPQQPEIKEHVVKKGESMSSITRFYYGDTSLIDELCKYNNISDPDKIMQGQVIKIPPKEVLKAQ